MATATKQEVFNQVCLVIKTMNMYICEIGIENDGAIDWVDYFDNFRSYTISPWDHVNYGNCPDIAFDLTTSNIFSVSKFRPSDQGSVGVDADGYDRYKWVWNKYDSNPDNNNNWRHMIITVRETCSNDFIKLLYPDC